MAIREIRKDGDEVLRKRSKEVEVINERVLLLIKDLVETMYHGNGVGLAAPQVGILKRVIVIDVGEGPIEFINPKIISASGEQNQIEGCLSVPEVFGAVKRPEKVVATGMNMKGEDIRIEGEGLLAIALCHEIDHLDGILFKDKAENILDRKEYEETLRPKRVRIKKSKD